jgi:hypothetical protein
VLQEFLDPDDPRNRRQHGRIRVTIRVKLEATLRGRFKDIMRLETAGVTIDMSEGGFCANVDQSISPGVRCRVEIADEAGQTNETNETDETQTIWGRVRRTTGAKQGFVVALEFDEPLVAADPLGGAAKGAIIEVAGGDEA